MATAEVPRGKSAKSEAHSSATGPSLAITAWRSSRSPVMTTPAASASPVISSTGATARSGRPLTRVRKAVT